MSVQPGLDPEILFEQQRTAVEAQYATARFDHMGRFFEANPELAEIRAIAIDNMVDLEEFPVHESHVTYEEPQYRWAEANYAWVTAQEQQAFLREQRAEIAAEDEAAVTEIDAFLSDLDDEIALREYMKNLYDAQDSATRVAQQTKLFDFPTTQGVGPDWVGMGDQMIEARLKRDIFDARYKASGYQDYGYAPDDRDITREFMELRDGRNLPVPTDRRFFTYQPFTRDPRELIKELADAKEAIGEPTGRFFDMRTAQMVVDDPKANDQTVQEAKEILAEEQEWWDGLAIEEQADIIRTAEAYSFSVQHTYRQLISGFAPVINMAIDKVKNVYPHAHDQGNFKKLQEDAILSAAFYFSRVYMVLDLAKKDRNDVQAIMGYLYAQIIVGFNNIVLDGGKKVESKRLHNAFEGTGGLPEVIFEEGYFDNEQFAPERLRPFTMGELTGYKPGGRKKRLGSIASGATIVLQGSRTLQKPASTVQGYDPLKGFDEKIARASTKKPGKGLTLPGLE